MDAYECPRIRSQLAEPSPTATFRMVLIVFVELFHALWRVVGSDFCCSVIYICPENYSANYKFRFTILKNNARKISCFFVTQSYIEDIDEVLKPQKCMTIKYHTIQEFLIEENDLLFELEVWQST
jgi:hypothetical protein